MATFHKLIQLIHIHPILIFFIFISIVTGTFTQLFIILTIVLIHEIGHFLAATYYKWRIYSIVLWVFGGVLKTDESGNRPIKQDIIVTIAGPLQHLFIFGIIYGLAFFKILPDRVIDLALYYNAIILSFNLLPVYPLDGGKLLFYLLSAFVSFRNAHYFTVAFSLIVCMSLLLFQLLFLPFTLSAFLLIIFLILENRTEWKNHYYIFIRFLVSRLHYPPSTLKKEYIYVDDQLRLIDIFSLFRRNRIYEIGTEENKGSISEQKSLHLYFKKNKINETIGELIHKK